MPDKYGNLTVEEMQEQGRILSEAKQGMQRERLQQFKAGAKKFAGMYQQRMTPSKQQIQGIRKASSTQAKMSSVKRLAAAILPIPARAVYGASGTPSRRPSTRVKYGRGRPKGAFDARYAKYGGVMNYRRVMARQNAYNRLIQAQQGIRQGPMTYRQQIMARQAARQAPQQMQQMPQQYTQEGQQMPQEMAQMQPQPQYQEQMPQENMQVVGMDRPSPQSRPIVPVFKGSGGSLGYEVNRAPLANNPQGDYYEQADPWTGRRTLVRRPQAETWLK